MFKDNKDLYPTPESLIRKMMSGLDFRMINSILEPSAGSGNILDEIKKKEEFVSSTYNKVKFDVDCIENDVNLRSILKDKGHRLVFNDFLLFDTMKEYDLIIMNPPYSNGCKHLLKALSMQERSGGAIVCLLNAETLKNDFSNERKDLNRKLKEYNAEIEYISDGFIDAERTTDVETALIKINIPKVTKESFILKGLKQTREQREYTEFDNTTIIENDFFKSIVNQYKLEVEAGVNLIKEYYAMSPFILSAFVKDEKTGETKQTGGCILSLDLSENKDKYSNNLSVNGYIKGVRKKYWKALFDNKSFIGQLTGDLQRDFYNRIEDLSNYDFSLYNIFELKIEMTKNVVKGIEETIIALFDEFSHKYYWDKTQSSNIHYYNGWKTNSAYKINRKVIIPLSAYCEYSGRFEPSRYKALEKLQDIEKCFNYLDGGVTDHVELKESLKFAEEYMETKNIETKYFTITFYQKGTCHLTFKNEELLKKFNIFGSQKKGWLPNSYGEKSYKDMTPEEKSVINEFEGEVEYAKVMNNRNYYLFDSNNAMMIEDKTA